MTQVRRITPLLTAMHRYEKTVSTWQRGHGQMIDAPILAYLIETRNGRVLYDVGCDHAKVADPVLRNRHYGALGMPPPDMRDDQRVPHHLARLGLTPADIDLIFIGHLHFDHAGGLKDLRRCGCGAEIHVQLDEWRAATSGDDGAVFQDDLIDDAGLPLQFALHHGEYSVLPGIEAIASPGHTAGHMSLWIEQPDGRPVLLCGDAADLQENLDEEIAPGTLWQGRESQAIDSIRKLKTLARETGATLWPNHDIAFWRGLTTTQPVTP